MAKIIPYTDYLYVRPNEKKQVLVSERSTLQTYGEVLAVGPDVTSTKVEDTVAFELWDKTEFSMETDENYHFVREKDVICKIDALP